MPSAQYKLIVYSEPQLPLTDSHLRCSNIPIPWGDSRVEVHHGDLLPAAERANLPDWPSLKLNLASISLPRGAYFKRLLGQCKELYVVSPESSPTNSPENSQQISPNSTFRTSHDSGPTKGGATRQ